MENFKKMLHAMEEELEGAMSYAKMASCYSSYNPQAATTFTQMSIDELNHATNLKNMAELEMKKHADSKSEHATAMKTLFEFEYEKYMDMAAEINGYKAAMGKK